MPPASMPSCPAHHAREHRRQRGCHPLRPPPHHCRLHVRLGRRCPHGRGDPAALPGKGDARQGVPWIAASLPPTAYNVVGALLTVRFSLGRLHLLGLGYRHSRRWGGARTPSQLWASPACSIWRAGAGQASQADARHHCPPAAGNAISSPPMLKKILIANRGEIALRIVRTATRLGVQTVAVVSEADRGAPFARVVGEVVEIGPGPPSESYLRGDRIIAAAK